MGQRVRGVEADMAERAAAGREEVDRCDAAAGGREPGPKWDAMGVGRVGLKAGAEGEGRYTQSPDEAACEWARPGHRRPSLYQTRVSAQAMRPRFRHWL